ncbi:spore maturation protein B [Halalkalibacter akibai JCM 9157]|uniref:Spore maturation protein B n=1 Tax=Halalkalibacter akibai (strain ATCC 43226 / DSM 21942 / CIP 109018 / JCM 9157 / 1139) TaxID=1236973 RepID=W4QW44_HALA3|nr:spore maturation protein B [Halalkalibacter akibai JCM 9157]
MGWITVISIWFIPVLIAFVLMYGTYKQVPTYETFVEGAKEGFGMAISIIHT